MRRANRFSMCHFFPRVKRLAEKMSIPLGKRSLSFREAIPLLYILIYIKLYYSIYMLSTLKEWLKKREIALFLLLFLISSLSFGLGYLLAKQNNVAPIIIEKATNN